MSNMIDAHHLWDLSVREQPWLTGDQPWATEEELRPLRRSFTVADLAAVARPEGVTGTVVVQVLTEPAETADQIAAYRELPGGVAWPASGTPCLPTSPCSRGDCRWVSPPPVPYRNASLFLITSAALR